MPVKISEQLRHGTPLHAKILNAFLSRKKLGQQALDLRTAKWSDNEDAVKAYVKESDNDVLRKDARKDGMPQYTTVNIPYSYATMLTIHTYLTSVLLSRSPILQFAGRHGEAQQSEQCVEALIDYQVQTGGAIPPLYIWLLDALRYGHGIVGSYWDKEEIPMTVKEKVQPSFLGMPIGSAQERMVTTLTTGYIGNRSYNVRPHDFMSDPRVPLWRFQEGEFCIRFDSISWNRVAERFASGAYFNADHLDASSDSHASFDRDMGSPRTLLPDSVLLDTRLEAADGKRPGRIKIHEFYFELIPSEWNLGNSTRPEKWVFTIANEKVIIGAQPLGLQHGKYPFDVLECEIGGHELFNRSVLEITEPLNDVLTWLFNSHFYNVRKTLNDQFLVDPSRVVMRDMEDPNPGRLIRLKPVAYGTSLDNVMKQFPVSDVTRAHIPDSEMVMSILQRITGANDNVMGMVNTSGRKTATEVRSSTSFGVNRLKTTVEWMSVCGFAPWAQKLVQSSQQLYDMERKFRIVGDLGQWGQRFLTVNPEAIAGFYDYVPVDGTLPVDRYAQANLWQQIFAGLGKMPQVAGAYDMPKMFAFVAQLAGLKNISQFRINVMPDAQLAAQARAGNMVPIAQGNQSEPGQVPGNGPTG